jgi:hypothetical protein
MANEPFDPDTYLSTGIKKFNPEDFVSTPPTARITVRPTTQTDALLKGYLSGATANLADEIYGLSEASGLPRELGGFRAPVGLGRYGADVFSAPAEAKTTGPEQPSGMVPAVPAGLPTGGKTPFMEAYERAATERRAEQKAAQEQYPGTYLTGEAAGSMVLPGGMAGRVATPLQRMGRGAAFGTGYGALAGAGAGENPLERGKGALFGGALGFGLGAGGPVATELGLGLGQRTVGQVGPTIRGLYNPTGEAERHVAASLLESARSDPRYRTRYTQQEAAGSPAAMVVDLGSEPTRSLARVAANLSAPARDTLEAALDPRYAGQANRVSSWLGHMFNFPNAFHQERALTASKNAVNNPNYRAAYTAGAGHVGSPELERLAGFGEVADAMRKAMKNADTEAAIGGYGAMNPRITLTPDGRVQFNRQPNGMPAYPDLQFWDLTQRELRSQQQQALRAGNDTDARRYGALRRMLNDELDQQVPEFRTAREGAAHFFGAENALEAGQNFLGQGERFGNDAARAAKSRMSPLQRQLFEDGYVSALMRKLLGTKDARDIVNRFGDSEAAREELQVALGPERAAALMNLRRQEEIMTRARTAVKGNSTTMRQYAEMYGTQAGLGIGAAGLGGLGAYHADPAQVGFAAALGGLAAGKHAVNRNVMGHVADILTQRTPTQGMMDAITNQAVRAHRSATVRSMLNRGILGAGEGIVYK